jgi:hypothetical protein
VNPAAPPPTPAPALCTVSAACCTRASFLR